MLTLRPLLTLILSYDPRALRSGTRTTVWTVWSRWRRWRSWQSSSYVPIHCWQHCKQCRWYVFAWQQPRIPRQSCRYRDGGHGTSCCLHVRGRCECVEDQVWKRNKRLWTRCGIFNKPLSYLVIAAGLANSNFRFLRMGLRLPPVARRLCQWSLDIPISYYKVKKWRLVRGNFEDRVTSFSFTNYYELRFLFFY